MQSEKCKSCFECSETVVVKVRDERGGEWRNSSVRRCANDQCWHIVAGTREDRLAWISNVYDYKYFGDYELSPEQLSAVYEAKSLAAISEQERAVEVTALDERMKAEMLRLAVAAVLEADTEFRAHMPKGWEGDPLSDEIDGLRRCFEASPPLSRQGEDRAEVVPHGLAERCGEILEWKKTGKLPGDSLRQLGQSIADRLGGSLFIDNGLNQAELATIDEALKLIVALAATRSGSASTATGTSPIRQKGESDG